MGIASPPGAQAGPHGTGAKRSRPRISFARELGLNLQRCRLERGYSQERLAHLAGLSAYTYQKYEKGESKPGTPMNPRLFSLLALAQVLGVTVSELLPADLPDLSAT